MRSRKKKFGMAYHLDLDTPPPTNVQEDLAPPYRLHANYIDGVCAAASLRGFGRVRTLMDSGRFC